MSSCSSSNSLPVDQCPHLNYPERHENLNSCIMERERADKAGSTQQPHRVEASRFRNNWPRNERCS